MPRALPTAAVVLAHGRGDHCFPYGGTGAPRPKYAMEVANRPLLEHLLAALADSGIGRVTVVSGFRAEAVESVARSFGRGVEVVRIADYDAGDAVALACALRERPYDEPLVVANGDLLVSGADVRRVLNAWSDGEPDAVALLVDQLDPEEDAASWIGVELSGDRVTSFRGHDAASRFRLTGLAVVSAQAVKRLARAERGSQERRYLDSQWESLRADGTPLVAVTPHEPVVHVDRCFDYLEAINVVRDRALRLIADARGVYGYVGGEGDPDPRFIFPGTLISPGKRVVLEEGGFIGPYDTYEAHLSAVKKGNLPGVLDIRIRGNIHLGRGFRIGLNSLLEGDLATGAEGYLEDSVIEGGVLLGDRVRVRRGAVVRNGSVCGDGSRYECAADFQGVAGPGTVYMHPGQCLIVTGRKCDLGAGNFFGTWRFDSGRARYLIGGRLVTPKSDALANASYLGDEVRTAVMVSFAPGTRVGANTLIGQGIAAARDYEPGSYYRLRQDVERLPVETVRPRTGG